jgi:predicted naringenin-chalcone synthase
VSLEKPSYIFGLATVVPDFCISQEAYVQFACQALELPEKQAAFLKNICARTAINQRYFTLEDPLKKRAEWTFLSQDYPRVVPTTTERAHVYQREAPKLAYQAAVGALHEWGQNKNNITHIISVSCTGALAPGLEFLLMHDLGLTRSVQRFGLNFMGCFGAIRGLAVAHAFARENSKNRILMVCTELCSLHFQAEFVPHHVIANALFGDGAAAVIVGSEPTAHEKPLWRFEKFQATAIEDSLNDMTWDISDRGFIMYLSARVPQLLSQIINPFVRELMGSEESLTETVWAIHPGGKAIIQGIEKACQLEPWQTQASWETLASYGNMSSPTVLFVLDKLRQNQAPWATALAFGPGLSLESVLLEKFK